MAFITASCKAKGPTNDGIPWQLQLPTQSRKACQWINMMTTIAEHSLYSNKKGMWHRPLQTILFSYVEFTWWKNCKDFLNAKDVYDHVRSWFISTRKHTQGQSVSKHYCYLCPVKWILAIIGGNQFQTAPPAQLWSHAPSLGLVKKTWPMHPASLLGKHSSFGYETKTTTYKEEAVITKLVNHGLL